MIDISLNEKAVSTLRSLIGKSFDAYACDPFQFSPSVFGVVGFTIDGETYKLTAAQRSVQRFFSTEDAAVLDFAPCTAEEAASCMDGGQFIPHPVKDIICSIDMVNDLESVTHEGDQRKFFSTKGLIFHLKSGNEISFELDTWFSEMITIRQGYHLIEKFTPLESFYDEWDAESGYVPACIRNVATIR